MNTTKNKHSVSLKLNKKSQLFIIGLVLIVLLVLIYGYVQLNYNYRIKSKQLDSPMGEKQTALVSTYQRAEDALFYIDQAAEYAYYSSLLDMAEDGGVYDNSICGEHIYNLWNLDDKECYPVFKKSFDDFMNPSLNYRLSRYSSRIGSYYEYQFNQTYSPTKLKLHGMPIQEINFPITKEDVAKRFIDAGGNFVFPLDYDSNGKLNVVSCYGCRCLQASRADLECDGIVSCSGSEVPNFHDGIDFHAAEGTPIYSIEEGIVEDTCEEWTGTCACSIATSTTCEANCDGRCGNYGNFVLIKHPGNIYSRYSHLKSISVQKGQNVSKGAQIALSGDTGYSGGPHLDLKIYDSPDVGHDKGVNPLCFYSNDPQLGSLKKTASAKSCEDKYGKYARFTKANSQLKQECTDIDSNALIFAGASSGSCSFSVKLDGQQEPRLNEREVNKLLENTPLKDLGYFFVGESQTKKLDNTFALAMFKHESSLGTAGIAVRNKNVGNIRVPYRCTQISSSSCTSSGNERKTCTFSCTDFSAIAADCPKDLDMTDRQGINQQCFSVFADWKDGVAVWYNLISGSLYFGSGKTTVETIIPTYAPSGDNNDVVAYIRAVKQTIAGFGVDVPVCEEINSVFGSYSVEPHFTTEANFDKEIYKKLIVWAKETAEKCQEDDIEACLDEQMTAFNDSNKADKIFLSRNCEDRFWYYDFAEQFEDCMVNEDEDCVCKISLQGSRGEDFKVRFVDGSFHLVHHDDDEMTFYIGQEQLIFRDDPDGSGTKSFSRNNYAAEFKQPGSGEQYGVLEKELLDLGGPSSYTLSDGMLIYRSEDEGLVLVKEDGGKTECVPKKVNYRLCLSTQDKVLDPENALQPENVKIRFALELRDRTPPDAIQGLEGKMDGNAIALKWLPSSAPDLNNYMIYYVDPSNPDNIGYFELPAVAPLASYSSINWDNMQCSGIACTFLVKQILNPLFFEQDIPFDSFHKLTDEQNRLFYLFELPSGFSTPLDIYVTATDHYDNEVEIFSENTEGENYISLS